MKDSHPVSYGMCTLLFSRSRSGSQHAKVQNIIDCLPRMISSERFNLLWPNVVWKFIIMSQCHVKMFCYFQGQGYSVGSYYRFYYVSSTGDPFATKLSLIGHHHKPDCLVKRRRIALFEVKFIMTVQQATEY